MAKKARESAMFATNLLEKDKKKIEGTNGKYTYVYVGEQVCGFFSCSNDGLGVQTWSNGEKYEGMFKGGNYQGLGVKRWSDRQIFEGSWENGKMHGRGKMTYSDGSVRFGRWKDGIFMGLL